MNLESGFLILYDWMAALETLSGEDFKALVMALIARQRSGIALPSFENPIVRIYASMIEPTIERRLKGRGYAKQKKGVLNTPEATPEATLEATLEGTTQASRAEQRKAEIAQYSGAKRSRDARAEEPLLSL